ncbi:hypothetical protein KTC96_23270 (plasmid) [Clostridium estertheticum]|uniref:hypothetical protein n=1 Tax=Clostridium estertheticum TaxID=238834 RepID=UPI001C7D8704|nr:hypothetical protein [Clostridium estertheticum]MBX4262782.1 hypothetical protein [Clostridium estertheticum]WLC72816.1 hypothetical protein KTC96_23270 [Clostridium estertheticum]
MNNISKYISISSNNIRRWLINPRIYILATLLSILLWNYLSPILNFSNSMRYRVTPWIFPFISDFAYTHMMMMFGIVFLFCDAPFMNEGQPYFLIRCGRTQWAMGQVFYIMIGTLIYFLFISFVSILMISTNLFFSNSWGKILGTLAQSTAGQAFNIQLPISYTIQSLYTPIQAFGLSFMLQWCAGTILGLIMFVINVYGKQSIGSIVASVIVLFDIAIEYEFKPYAYHFSPVSMARLTILDPSGLSQRPTIIYACVFLAVAITLLSIIAVLSVHKREIQVLPPI